MFPFPPKTTIPDLADVVGSFSDFSFIQVGALDGVSFDPLYPLIAANPSWHGLVVEPIPHAFRALCETYKNRPNVVPLNVAIDPNLRQVVLNYIPPDGDLPDWSRGISSIYLKRNSLSGKNLPPPLASALKIRIRQHLAEATTLDALCTRHAIRSLDWLQIDTEGHDWQVLRSLDLRRLRPRHIHLEYYNLPRHEKFLLFLRLRIHGYTLIRDHKDLLATRA